MSEELKKEIIGIGLLGVFAFILISLLSYQPFDPSLNTVASDTVRNFCGRAGSYTSDFLIQLFEIMSYAVTCFILAFSIIFLRRKAMPHLLILGSGFLLFFLSMSALLQITVGKIQVKTVTIPFSGLLGLLLERGLLHAFSYFGSLLLSVILFLISLF